MQVTPNKKEVAHIFSVPLEAFLYHEPPAELERVMHVDAPESRPIQTIPTGRQDGPGPIPDADENESRWHSIYEVYWLGERLRRHTFWDARNPIRGLTRYAAGPQVRLPTAKS